MIGPRAERPNARLGPFAMLVGRWTTSGRHPLLPGVTLRGRVSFEWIAGGAFLLMRSEMDDARIPSAVAIIGSDDVRDACFMLYADERGVTRQYDIDMRDGVLRWWRDAPQLSQRFTGTVSPDGRTIDAAGELSRDGTAWEPDLELTYRRQGS